MQLSSEKQRNQNHWFKILTKCPHGKFPRYRKNYVNQLKNGQKMRMTCLVTLTLRNFFFHFFLKNSVPYIIKRLYCRETWTRDWGVTGAWPRSWRTTPSSWGWTGSRSDPLPPLAFKCCSLKMKDYTWLTGVLSCNWRKVCIYEAKRWKVLFYCGSCILLIFIFSSYLWLSKLLVLYTIICVHISYQAFF